MPDQFAMLFPGQGSQSIGMLKEFFDQFNVVKETFDQASNTLNDDLWKVAQEGPKETLDRTTYTQPIILAADVAIYRCWKELRGREPAVMAGHSLGEYSALVCSNALKFEEALLLVSKRAQYMEQSCEESRGGMAAIIGLDEENVKLVCQEASKLGKVSPANFNSIGQTVIAGHIGAVEKAIELAKKGGAKIAKLIPVTIPAHSDLMQGAAQKLAIILEDIDIKEPVIPVLRNVDAKPHEGSIKIREMLIKQMTQPVQWVATIQALKRYAVSMTVECGPGKVLSGLCKRIDKELVNYLTFEVTLLKKAIEVLS